MQPETFLTRITHVLQDEPNLLFAVLVGSRATGAANADSDWDIALLWSTELIGLERLGQTETLRRRLATTIGVAESSIDLIDLSRANLAMRAVVAEEGKPLTGQNTIRWYQFLQRTWRELEEFYWDKVYAT